MDVVHQLGDQDDLAGERSLFVGAVLFLQAVGIGRASQGKRLADVRLPSAAAVKRGDRLCADPLFFGRRIEHREIHPEGGRGTRDNRGMCRGPGAL